MHTALSEFSAVELSALIKQRTISPLELVRHSIERAHKLQPTLNCFITICSERAIKEARLAEQALLKGETLGALHGVPFTVKDIVHTEAVVTSFGAVPLKDFVPSEDAVAVARLRRAGAILIGKTTTPEFGSKCLTDSPLFGKTANPWQLGRTSGGSSGGAAVAVAAGIAPIAIATDGGGSTRIPAACNGVVGIKQSLGLVPHSQAQDLFSNQTYVTPMTRTVADTALMLDLMGGEHPCDPWSNGFEKPDLFRTIGDMKSLRGKRIMAWAAPPERPLAAETRQLFELALLRLSDLGAVIEPVEGNGMDIEPIWRTINHTVWRTRFAALAARYGQDLSDTFHRQLALAKDLSAVAYQEAMFERTKLFLRVQAMFGSVDFLAMPTISRSALSIDHDLFSGIDIDGQHYDELRANWFPNTMPFNMTGHPAISLPCGFDQDGMPLGLQLVGPLRGDRELLQVAALFEMATGLLNQRPMI
ncbi:MAG: amidase [Betaproteobacteria bacterium]|nr:amidase [Betaproteobacteria bacterium]